MKNGDIIHTKSSYNLDTGESVYNHYAILYKIGSIFTKIFTFTHNPRKGKNIDRSKLTIYNKNIKFDDTTKLDVSNNVTVLKGNEEILGHYDLD